MQRPATASTGLASLGSRTPVGPAMLGRWAVRKLEHLVRPPAWQVLRPAGDARWGSELRRRRVFEGIAVRRDAETIDRFGKMGLVRPAAQLHATRRPALLSAEQLPQHWLDIAAARTSPAAVAIYDDAVAQARALGIPLSPEDEAMRRDRLLRNHAAFAYSVVPTASFAELIGLDPDRVIVGGNGTDVQTIRMRPTPALPAVGFASGAAPGRGIELLVEAVRLVRESVPECRLILWLVATSPASEAYLGDLRGTTAGADWIEIRTAAYDQLGDELGGVSVLAIPHPPGDYFDVALPVKLFDSLAAGRPLVVTPRSETVKVVERAGAGLVAADDARDMATAIARLLTDATAAGRMGRAGRAAAEARYDWPVVSEAIARNVLSRLA